MRILYHWPLDPRSRQARLALGETKLRFKLEQINPWALDEKFLALSPEGIPPILSVTIPGGKISIAGARAICEYANDSATSRHSILPIDVNQRAEARRLCNWFDDKFSEEVDSYILHEKLEKPINQNGAPEPQVLREGRDNLAFHLAYIDWLLERREWLACNSFSLADIAAIAHISVLDFLGEIKWKDWPRIKRWYQRAKSRPSFRPMLKDHVAGIIPPRHYSDLDF